MTAPAWMPFYVADYLADTGHLSTLEHGAYLLLIMHYWQSGGLPTDETKLSRIARLSAREWGSVRDTLAALFASDWRHKRIDAELAKASENMERRSAAGKAGASARYGNRTGNRIANAGQSNSNPPSPSPGEEAKASPPSDPNGSAQSAPNGRDDPAKTMFDTGVRVLTERGVSERQARSVLGKCRGELKDDGKLLSILLAVDREKPIEPLAYLSKAVANAAGGGFTIGIG